jgi:hypothetical protein
MGRKSEDEEEEEWAQKIKRRKSQLHHAWKEEDHPGCEISGHLMVDRVPVRSQTKLVMRHEINKFFTCMIILL